MHLVFYDSNFTSYYHLFDLIWAKPLDSGQSLRLFLRFRDYLLRRKSFLVRYINNSWSVRILYGPVYHIRCNMFNDKVTAHVVVECHNNPEQQLERVPTAVVDGIATSGRWTQLFTEDHIKSNMTPLYHFYDPRLPLFLKKRNRRDQRDQNTSAFSNAHSFEQE